MAIAAAAVIVPLGLLFFISGLVVNLIQAVCFVTIRPLSKNTYRRINRWVAELLWLELVWIVDWWAGVKVIGWSMWFSEYLFLERNWAKDESTLKSGLQRLRDYPQPFWLALFVEGTRFTQAKLLAAQEYAASTGLPIPRNVLIPRTKGFVSAVSHMRSFVPAIYDVTVAIPKSSPAPTMIRLFKGQSSVMHVHLKRHLMKELPETDDAVAQWCRDTFVAKDALLDKHNAEDTFSDQELQEIPRPKKSLLVVISWASLVIFGVLKFLQWSSLLSSWKGIAFSAFGLGIVTVLMQILIRFSQSERSTPAKVVPSKPKNSKEPEQTTQDKQR
ncbi:1-acyl-sn-glycerol-3-phosphate acyltransferase 2 isoform X2 [Citrus clementina]|uniref:1-acyl-sn-glycerol-3-phosphate acyltransferase 2 isoform X2 n=1 Tax=Citrus clementina TaxID=85681 RepID=UPI000CED59E4|nr:1-acyl-sn-glycerol-3-phosphate acyltransferase 2 isoform X2 [Citrus x clementina]